MVELKATYYVKKIPDLSFEAPPTCPLRRDAVTGQIIFILTRLPAMFISVSTSQISRRLTLGIHYCNGIVMSCLCIL